MREAESEAVERALDGWPGVATSAIGPIELRRAVLRARDDHRESVADDTIVDGIVDAIAEVPLTTRVREAAGRLPPSTLRSLDAIHLASALALGSDLAALLTYDERLSVGAEGQDVTIIAPR